jgi:glycosyltransferase involved in cell wall biosynthesis
MRYERSFTKMAYKERITFVYPHPSTFIQRDFDMLSEEYDVRPVEYKSKIDILRLKFKLINTNVNISWFALGHATLSVLISKIFMLRSIVIVGGWDVVYMPEIKYGAMSSKRRIRKTKIALKYATKVVCVSKSIAEHTKKWTNRKDLEIIPLGFDPEKFKPEGEKENLVITAGSLKNEITIKVKGLDHFFKCAQLLPEVQFILIGSHDPEIRDEWESRAPDNLKILDFVPQKELIEYYQRAKVYAQLSFQESFGSALAEAMLCECVPVVTRRGALPEVVGDCGFYADYGSENETVKMIKKALISDYGPKARERIATQFPLSKRKEELIRIIDEI